MTATQKKAAIAAAVLIALVLAYGTYQTSLQTSIQSSLFGGNECPSWSCGANSAEVVGYPLHLDGEPNDDDYRLTGFDTRNSAGTVTRYALDGARFASQDGQVAVLDVRDSRFVLLGPDGAAKTGEPVSALLVGRGHRMSKKDFEIPVIEVTSVQSWASAPGQEPRQIPAYLLENHLPGSTASKLCPSGKRWAEPGEAPAIAQVARLRWADRSHHAVLIKGERYDSDTVRVTPGQRWVTLACAGSALAKMKLMGYDPETPRGDAFFTTPEQRQATIKMITATYCEVDGKSPQFTRDGTPLAWKNRAGWLEPPWSLVRNVEARWNAEGATCLEEPRLVSRDKVVNACGELPRCPQLDASSQDPPTYPIGDNEWVTFTRDGSTTAKGTGTEQDELADNN